MVGAKMIRSEIAAFPGLARLERSIRPVAYLIFPSLPHLLFLASTVCSSGNDGFVWASYERITLPLNLPFYISRPRVEMIFRVIKVSVVAILSTRAKEM